MTPPLDAIHRLEHARVARILDLLAQGCQCRERRLREHIRGVAQTV
jgi:hypothetical protein